ncbi:hypothetical protein ACF3DV_25800 [Chlorogloeopsis fritschii PCC 9212]|uniref:hypothetical protein n=1 Tax=Chlorogloeopsis fritschii TaxID=1124 RepID=UPI00030D0669|nr:hypothetical protein [Chlorogloeopsis fritschii]
MLIKFRLFNLQLLRSQAIALSNSPCSDDKLGCICIIAYHLNNKHLMLYTQVRSCVGLH